MCKLGEISQERLKTEVKLLLYWGLIGSHNYMPRRLAQRATLSDLEWPHRHLSLLWFLCQAATCSESQLASVAVIGRIARGNNGAGWCSRLLEKWLFRCRNASYGVIWKLSVNTGRSSAAIKLNPLVQSMKGKERKNMFCDMWWHYCVN